MPYLKEALEAYKDTDIYPFHMPGHKRQALDFVNPYEMDITEIDGFDNLHDASGILDEAQKRAAKLYGSKECFYLVNGSTCGLLAAISAATKKGERVLVARNSHKAVYHALFLRELKTEYLYPVVTDAGIQGQITIEQVEESFQQYPDIAAVIITSPTYEGVVSDVAGIAQVVHRYGVPLIVDQAHGAHFGFGAGFPESAVRQGADAVIMSLHKTMPSFTQTALLHLCSDRISKEQVKKYLGIYETSSPSYLFMAGMDACVHRIEEDGAKLFAEYRKKLDEFYEVVRDLKYLHVMCREDLQKEEVFDWDDSKIVIFTGSSGMTGEKLHQRLLQEYHLQMEMVSGDYVLATTSLMDTQEGFIRLSEALHEIDNECGTFCKKNEEEKGHFGGFIEQIYCKNKKEMELFQAWELPKQEVSFDEAIGKMSADYLYLYPPGIPILVPGEVITIEFLEKMKECKDRDLMVHGSTNLSSGRINIVYF